MDLQETTEESLNNATDFFTTPPVMLSEEESYYMKVFPITSIDNQAPLIYEFDIDDGHYADLNNCFHYLRMRIMKSDRTTEVTAPGNNDQGNPIADGNNQLVAPINYFGNTLFQNVELYLNGELVESSNNLYPYKSYLQAFLSYSGECKKSQLAVAGYYADTGGVDTDAIRNRMNNEACENEGLLKRFKLARYSTPVTTISPLHLDFSTQQKYLQNRTHVKIRLSRVDAKFGLISSANNGNFSFIFQRAYLLVRMIKPRESLRLAVEEALTTTDAKYPVKKCEMRFYTFSGTSNSLHEPNLYSGHLPTRIALGLVETAALDGHFQKSPFNFKPFNVNEVNLKVNGKSITNDPIKIDLANSDYVLPYFWLYKGTGGFLDNESIVNYEEYKNGNFLYVFDLTEDGDHGLDEYHQPKSGVISIDIRTSPAANHPLALVAMFENEIIITCDKDRNYKVIT